MHPAHDLVTVKFSVGAEEPQAVALRYEAVRDDERPEQHVVAFLCFRTSHPTRSGEDWHVLHDEWRWKEETAHCALRTRSTVAI